MEVDHSHSHHHHHSMNDDDDDGGHIGGGDEEEEEDIGECLGKFSSPDYIMEPGIFNQLKR